MKLLLDSFWRAAAYCLHPRVIALSVLPLVLMVVAALGLGYLFWDAAIDAVNGTLETWSLVTMLFEWLDRFGMSGLKSALARMSPMGMRTLPPGLCGTIIVCLPTARNYPKAGGLRQGLTAHRLVPLRQSRAAKPGNPQASRAIRMRRRCLRLDRPMTKSSRIEA